MLQLETKTVFKQEKTRMLGEKETQRSHTHWLKLYNTSDKLHKCVVISTNRLLNTQLHIMIKEKTTHTMFLAGCTDWLPALPWKPLLPMMKKLQIHWQLLGVSPVQSLLIRPHEISHLHPAPPWHHLYREPILELPLKCNRQFRWTTPLAQG